MEPKGEFRGEVERRFKGGRIEEEVEGEGLKIEIPSVPNGVDRRAFVVFERCVGPSVSGPKSS